MKVITKILIIVLGLLPSLITVSASAAPTTDDKLFTICDDNARTAKSPICNDRDTTVNPVNKKIKIGADVVALATGLAAVVLIILGGFSMITSAGNTEAVTNARKRIFSAVIGLVIVALAWTVISFVTDRLIK